MLTGTPAPATTAAGRAQRVQSKRGARQLVCAVSPGSVIVYAGTSDMGQGARTVFAQIAADELGAPLDWVTVVMVDTAVVPYDQQTSASRSTVLMGNAILGACREIQAKVRAMASRLHAVDEAGIAVDHGVVRLPDREVPIVDVLKPGLGRLGGEPIGVGETRKEDDPGHPLGGSAAFFELNCAPAEVEVDEETGDIIRRTQGLRGAAYRGYREAA